MSSIKDPFEILANEITLIRRQIDQLQRTSLNKDEAEALNELIARGVERMGQVGPAVQKVMQRDLAQATIDVRAHAVEAARSAAKEAIEKSHTESLKAAKDLSRAAGEARREAWRYFGGFWGWLASIGAGGVALGLLTALLIIGRGDAREFGQYPRVYCTTVGGQIVTQDDGSSFCAIWIEPPSQSGS